MKKTIASLLTAAIATMSFGSMMTANAKHHIIRLSEFIIA